MNRENDYLNRDKDIANICKIIKGLQKNHTGATFAIDGIWGCGKSFFLRLLENKLSISDEGTDHIILHYDCWKYNYYDEPIIPIMSILNEGILQITKKVNFYKMPDVVVSALENLRTSMSEYAGHIVESKIGFNPYKMYIDSKTKGENKRQGDNVFDEKFYVRTALQSVRKELAKVAKQRTIIFIVDELDRCLPQYAIKVLESIHHFFSDIEGVITILAIDKQELEHIIIKTYGEHTNVERYLKKIIDFYIPLGVGNLNIDCIYKYSNYIKHFCGEQEDIVWVKGNINRIMRGLNIRAQEKIWKKAELIHNILGEEELDYSCLFLEIFIITEQYRLHIDYDVKNDSSNVEYDEAYILFWKDIKEEKENCLQIRKDGKTYYCLDNNILGRVKWYIENLGAVEYDDYCGKYYFENSTFLRDNIEKMREFQAYSKIIN